MNERRWPAATHSLDHGQAKHDAVIEAVAIHRLANGIEHLERRPLTQTLAVGAVMQVVMKLPLTGILLHAAVPVVVPPISATGTPKRTVAGNVPPRPRSRPTMKSASQWCSRRWAVLLPSGGGVAPRRSGVVTLNPAGDEFDAVPLPNQP
jgi:hypothetical protein